jgi:hypothetical protein
MKTIFTILLVTIFIGNTAIAKEKIDPPVKDSIQFHVVHQLIVKKIVDPLEKCKKLRSERSSMDKIGHRTKFVVDNFKVDFNNAKGNWIIVNEGSSVLGELKKVDGNQQSHICSFKVNPKTNEVMARTTATSKWLSSKQFVKKIKKKSK